MLVFRDQGPLVGIQLISSIIQNQNINIPLTRSLILMLTFKDHVEEVHFLRILMESLQRIKCPMRVSSILLVVSCRSASRMLTTHPLTQKDLLEVKRIEETNLALTTLKVNEIPTQSLASDDQELACLILSLLFLREKRQEDDVQSLKLRQRQKLGFMERRRTMRRRMMDRGMRKVPRLQAITNHKACDKERGTWPKIGEKLEDVEWEAMLLMIFLCYFLFDNIVSLATLFNMILLDESLMVKITSLVILDLFQS